MHQNKGRSVMQCLKDRTDYAMNGEKQERRMIDTADYVTEYAGFGCASSDYAPSSTNARFGSRLCLRSSDLAIYCGKQFIKLWADFNLTRK